LTYFVTLVEDDPDMMAAMEIEPEKFRPQYKVHKIFRVGW